MKHLQVNININTHRVGCQDSNQKDSSNKFKFFVLSKCHNHGQSLANPLPIPCQSFKIQGYKKQKNAMDSKQN